MWIDPSKYWPLLHGIKVFLDDNLANRTVVARPKGFHSVKVTVVSEMTEKGAILLERDT